MDRELYTIIFGKISKQSQEKRRQRTHDGRMNRNWTYFPVIIKATNLHVCQVKVGNVDTMLDDRHQGRDVIRHVACRKPQRIWLVDFHIFNECKCPSYHLLHVTNNCSSVKFLDTNYIFDKNLSIFRYICFSHSFFPHHLSHVSHTCNILSLLRAELIMAQGQGVANIIKQSRVTKTLLIENISGCAGIT